MCRDHKWCRMYFNLQKRMLQPSFSLMRLMPLQQLDSMLRLGLIRRCNVYWWSSWTRYPHLHSHCTCLCRDQVGKMPNTPHWALSGTRQCSPVENLTVLLQGFCFFSSFVFCCYTSTKKYYFYSVRKGMPVVGPILSGKRSEFQTWHPTTEHWVEEHVKLHVLFAEHWKPCCMVSCRTLQGERCGRRQAKYVPDRAQ